VVLGSLDVELDRALISIDRQEIGTLAFQERRTPFASLVADAPPLYFDHLRTQVTQGHAAERPGQRLGHLDDANPG
jgi:hypothetical protein